MDMTRTPARLQPMNVTPIPVRTQEPAMTRLVTSLAAVQQDGEAWSARRHRTQMIALQIPVTTRPAVQMESILTAACVPLVLLELIVNMMWMNAALILVTTRAAVQMESILTAVCVPLVLQELTVNIMWMNAAQIPVRI